jgi:hypothetical protein
MQNHRIEKQTPLSPAGAYAAAGLAGVVVVGLWLGLAGVLGWQVLLAAAAVALLAALGIVWQARARAASRLQATLDAYAAREIARGLRRKAAKRARALAARGPVLQSRPAPRTEAPQLVSDESAR